MHPAPSALRVLLVPVFVGLAAVAACRDTTAPESPASVVDSDALMAKSAGTQPFHIQQRFERAPDAETVDCGSGLTLPSRFLADGTLAPHLGRTNSLLVTQSCSVSGDTVSLSGVARHTGATRDTLYAIWTGEVDRTTDALTLQMILVGGTGRFHQTAGSAEAGGEIDLSQGTGWYRGSGTIGAQVPFTPPPRAVPLLPQTITAGGYHSCGLTSEGVAYCWGYNAYGQLGDGTTNSSPSPVPVLGGLTVTEISAGLNRTCAITAVGDVYCWGWEYGLTPQKIPGGIAFRKIDLGDNHSCGLTGEGKAYCWGTNHRGQLGDGTTTNRGAPTPVAPEWGSTTPLTFAQISAGGAHTCGVVPTGWVYCWGWGEFGQLGNGHTISSYYPLSYQSIYGGVTEVSAGGEHTCAITAGDRPENAPPGIGVCWGRDVWGQLGDGGFSPPPFYDPLHPVEAFRTTPVPVTGGIIFSQIRAGGAHTCGLDRDGRAACWGENGSGKLGDGTTRDQHTPVAVANEGAFSHISSGGRHTCGISTGGIGYCWGLNQNGEVGDGTTTQRNTPVVVAPFTFDRLSAGGNHSCALTVSDAAYCWGANYSGQLGDGTTTERTTPAGVVGGVAFWQISEGLDHSCGLTVAGVAYCWGDNLYGKLGDGTTTHRASPTPVSGGLVFARVRAGAEHTCGVANTGVVYCWGNNERGQLGDGTTTNRATPTPASGGYLFAELALGAVHTCALTNSGAAYCWGSDGVIEYHTPAVVPGALVFTHLSAGERFTCGLSGGTAYCWGINPDGQLGDGTTLNHPNPAPVSGGLSFMQLSTGRYHACGLTAAGAAYCWGWNLYGQLGDGTTGQRTVPTAVTGTLVWQRISGGLNHTCALTSSGAPYCWGRNERGQLGDGTTTAHLAPRPVAGRLLFKK